MRARIQPGVIVAASVAVLTLVLIAGCADKRPVNRDAMIKFAASKRTDTELKAMYAQAESESKRLIAEGRAERAARERERDENLAKCQVDVAFRTRNPDACRPAPYQVPMPLGMIFNPQDMYERALLGECEYVLTMGEAHEHGCLPPER